MIGIPVLSQEGLDIISPSFVKKRGFNLASHRIFKHPPRIIQQIVTRKGFMGGEELILPVKTFPAKLTGFMAPLMLRLCGDVKKVLFPAVLRKGCAEGSRAAHRLKVSGSLTNQRQSRRNHSPETV